MLDESGIGYLRGAVDVAAIEDAIWEYYAAKGIARNDPSTWPTTLLETKLQRLRKSGVFAPFANATVSAAITEILGEGWFELDAWGGPLITFPQAGPWRLPPSGWHSDHPAEGPTDRPMILRMFGFVNDVGAHGGATLVIEGSHELMRRLVAESPDRNAGKSAVAKRELRRRYPWFKSPSMEPTVIDGITVRVRELTGQAGDVAFMLPWTLHNVNMNCADQPRFMVTHTAYTREVS